MTTTLPIRSSAREGQPVVGTPSPSNVSAITSMTRPSPASYNARYPSRTCWTHRASNCRSSAALGGGASGTGGGPSRRTSRRRSAPTHGLAGKGYADPGLDITTVVSPTRETGLTAGTYGLIRQPLGSLPSGTVKRLREGGPWTPAITNPVVRDTIIAQPSATWCPRESPRFISIPSPPNARGSAAALLVRRRVD